MESLINETLESIKLMKERIDLEKKYRGLKVDLMIVMDKMNEVNKELGWKWGKEVKFYKVEK